MATTTRLRSQRGQPVVAADAGAPWSEPQISGRFETAIGSSIVEQIVIGHTPADVLQELVKMSSMLTGIACTSSLGQNT